ncbi:hypothetical protein CABS01_08245 [Colletotrichum abscissum]|uniref:uncharacterized protein n=1 Tax=Colletotrichum abscissum TaxID=1671311 RepID=UPI0027D5E229|nr:uncharacterized protein CABS01_08245 [Colletotrichum abscissum]KAK1509015.1 hypothetical protein CABS01_08245 [Colletotrichum abscissum]
MRRGGHRQPPGTDIAAAWRISLSCTAIDLILFGPLVWTPHSSGAAAFHHLPVTSHPRPPTESTVPIANRGRLQRDASVLAVQLQLSCRQINLYQLQGCPSGVLRSRSIAVDYDEKTRQRTLQQTIARLHQDERKGSDLSYLGPVVAHFRISSLHCPVTVARPPPITNSASYPPPQRGPQQVSEAPLVICVPCVAIYASWNSPMPVVGATGEAGMLYRNLQLPPSLAVLRSGVDHGIRPAFSKGYAPLCGCSHFS